MQCLFNIDFFTCNFICAYILASSSDEKKNFNINIAEMHLAKIDLQTIVTFFPRRCRLIFKIFVRRKNKIMQMVGKIIE